MEKIIKPSKEIPTGESTPAKELLKLKGKASKFVGVPVDTSALPPKTKEVVDPKEVNKLSVVNSQVGGALDPAQAPAGSAAGDSVAANPEDLEGLEDLEAQRHHGNVAQVGHQTQNARNQREVARMRLIDHFGQQSHFTHKKHTLAAMHFGSKHFWTFTVPSTLLSSTSGILAFLANSSQFAEETSLQHKFNNIVGSLSFLAVLDQTVSGKLNWDARAKMHESTAIDLRDLGEQLRNVMAMYRDADIVNNNNNDLEATFNVIQTRYDQCLRGCKSEVPPAINDAFNMLDAGLNLAMTQDAHTRLRRLHGPNYANHIYCMACDDLSSRFTSYWCWPLGLPNPHKVVAETMTQIRNNIANGDNRF